MQLSAKARLVSIIIAVVFMFGALAGTGTYLIVNHINNTNATTENNYLLTTNLFNTNGTINTTAAQSLLNALNYSKDTATVTGYSAHQILSRNNSSSYNGDRTIIFPMGYTSGTSGSNIYWQATYLYNNYLTIWMTKCYNNSTWNSSSVTVSYNSYASSTIQSSLNTLFNTLTQSKSALQSIFATPATVGYQELKSGTTNDTSYWYNSSYTSKFDNMSSTVGNSRYFWLPSFGEVFNNTPNEFVNDDANYTGLWGLNQTDRAFNSSNYNSGSTDYCWLRSGSL